MFKPGQLIRSELTGALYVVLAWPDALDSSSCVVNLNPDGIFNLVANNYMPFDDPRSWAAKAKLTDAH